MQPVLEVETNCKPLWPSLRRPQRDAGNCGSGGIERQAGDCIRRIGPGGLKENFFGAGAAGTAARRDTQFAPEVGHRRGAVVGGLSNLFIGHSVTKTDEHFWFASTKERIL